MKPVKVLQLVSPGFGGIEAFVFNYYKYMDRGKFQFDFLTQNPALEGAEQYRDFRYKVHLLRTTAGQNKERFIRRIREIFEDGYDVLHLNNCFWTGFLLEELAKEAGIRKVIVHSHSSFIDEPDDEKRAQLLRRHEEVKRAFSPELATDFWACSRLAADWLFGPQIPRDRISIIKNALDVEKYRFNMQKRSKIRDQLNLGDAFVLGTIGRLSYQKNHSFLVDLFSRFHQKYPHTKLLIVGDGELRGDLSRQILDKNLERDVLLLGWKNDVENYLQAMDVFLLPSRFEGLGIAAVEAAASGLPCIVSDQVPEEVALVGNIWHEQLDAAIWISVLEQLAGQRFTRESGCEKVRMAGYDIKHQAKVLEDLYLI